MTAYIEATKYIESIPKFAGKNTVEDIGRLLALLVGDEIKSRIIHVAGTNGKGSVCAYLRSVLQESNRSVGMFISPHLETMRERISLNGEWISKEEFTDSFEKVKRLVASTEGAEFSHPSFFEYLFLMAMCYFKEKQPDYIILETGLGGRLDATNCIRRPAVCIITEIGYDHMQYLGDTLEEIAAEKAGIMKTGVPVIFTDKRPETTKILKKFAQKEISPVVMLTKEQILNVNRDNKTIDFSLHTGYYNYVSLTLHTTAQYQTENASLAVLATEALKDELITPYSVRRGLGAAFWPGRMEEVLPGVYLDGAHNEDGIEAFLNSVREDGCRGKRLLLFGVVEDKRYEIMIRMIADSCLFSQVVVTGLETDRSASMDKLKKLWDQCGGTVHRFYEDAGEAYRDLLFSKGAEDTAYVVGSLYLIGQIKTLMRRMQDD